MLLEIKLADDPSLAGSVALGDVEFNRLAGVDFRLRPGKRAEVILTIVPDDLHHLERITEDNPLLIQVQHMPPTCSVCGYEIERKETAGAWTCGCGTREQPPCLQR